MAMYVVGWMVTRRDSWQVWRMGGGGVGLVMVVVLRRVMTRGIIERCQMRWRISGGRLGNRWKDAIGKVLASL